MHFDDFAVMKVGYNKSRHSDSKISGDVAYVFSFFFTAGQRASASSYKDTRAPRDEDKGRSPASKRTAKIMRKFNDIFDLPSMFSRGPKRARKGNDLGGSRGSGPRHCARVGSTVGIRLELL